MIKRRAAVVGSGFGGLAVAIRLQNAGFETVPDAGHAAHLEQPGHVAQRVRAFLTATGL